ncbi:MAG TPA: hypothetical protein VII06_34205 [Chloroflexota bacterium]|jgi:hypothetical protein
MDATPLDRLFNLRDVARQQLAQTEARGRESAALLREADRRLTRSSARAAPPDTAPPSPAKLQAGA